jgi:hypothetical protein
MRMFKNMKKKLTVIFASLALCFVSVGCSMDWDSYWTVYTDIWDYYDFSYYFRSEISDDCYKHMELTDDEWDDFRYVFIGFVSNDIIGLFVCLYKSSYTYIGRN